MDDSLLESFFVKKITEPKVAKQKQIPVVKDSSKQPCNSSAGVSDESNINISEEGSSGYVEEIEVTYREKRLIGWEKA